MQEYTDLEKLRICTLFTQWIIKWKDNVLAEYLIMLETTNGGVL